MGPASLSGQCQWVEQASGHAAQQQVPAQPSSHTQSRHSQPCHSTGLQTAVTPVLKPEPGLYHTAMHEPDVESCPPSEAQLLADLSTVMASLPGWLCSSMRDSLYRISLLSDSNSCRAVPATLTGVDLLVAQLLYSKGPVSSPTTPPVASSSVESGLPVPELDSLLLEQAWGNPDPDCAVPSKLPSGCLTPALTLHPAASADCPWSCRVCREPQQWTVQLHRGFRACSLLTARGLARLAQQAWACALPAQAHLPRQPCQQSLYTLPVERGC